LKWKDKEGEKFREKIESLSGENVFSCYQCGKCSGGCPSGEFMDLLPNQILKLIQLGKEEEVLKSKTFWLCSSCFTCTARCPKGVDLAKVMEAVRQRVLRKNVDWVNLREIEKEKLSELPPIALISNFRKKTS